MSGATTPRGGAGAVNRSGGIRGPAPVVFPWHCRGDSWSEQSRFEAFVELEAHTGINFTREGLLEPFEIADDVTVPPGTYDNTEAQIVFYTNQGAAVAFTAPGFQAAA